MKRQIMMISAAQGVPTGMVHKCLANLSPEWLESLYQQWCAEPESVDEQWQLFFNGFELGSDSGIIDHSTDEHYALKVSGVQSLIYRYRSIGHLLACTDPLSPCRISHPLLELQQFRLEESDCDRIFPTRRFGNGRETLAYIIERLQQTYCREIGVEFMHIEEPSERQWLIDRMEPECNHPFVSVEQQLQMLEKLNEANLFETFLQRHFPGQKRFSLEGGELLIAGLEQLAQACPGHGISDLVLGMAHRGRLNVLAHLFGKPYENVFAEFRDELDPGFSGDGDVKYHKGFSTDRSFDDGQLHLTLAANPSHLEAVNPVVVGKCRARQSRHDGNRKAVLPVLVHGDAAFSGQGSVMETLVLSRLDGYTAGGTLHIVLNNQIGFTTQPRDSRSSLYATDVAKMLACPIFHVQGESPEAVRHCLLLALSYRQSFERDVVVELICYRRHGHNEGDEPMFTQPLMYRAIAGRLPVNRLYADRLHAAGVDRSLLDASIERIQTRLDTAFNAPPVARPVGYKEQWRQISREYSPEPVDTAVPPETVLLLARKLAELPPGFTLHPKIAQLLQKRFESVLKGAVIDWGTAEALAFASLLNDGVSVRLSGEDSRRGTFSHRHSVVYDQHDQRSAVPLAQVAAAGARFEVWDSPLSEFGVLGFEYGYSLEMPGSLTLWEAQFGDFANGAQVVVDQFIASGETKWNRASGLVLLLPHGYEGQGGEHSSARVERFLQLCANNNLQVVNPTTPAQLFHLLRRQMKQAFRKPLILFTPKSLLRNPECVSSVSELSEGRFNPIIVDPLKPESVQRLLLCSGKVYYDLMAERATRSDSSTAIVRVEQLYPFIPELLQTATAHYRRDTAVAWVQEEPENMGAWRFVQPFLLEQFPGIRYIGRPADSSPAVGSHTLHHRQQQELIEQALSL